MGFGSQPALAMHARAVFAEWTVQKRASLSVFSLWQKEEAHISRNTSFMDAGILRWLFQNEGRLPRLESQQLSRTLTEFPGLIRHQALLMDERTYSLLESLLSSHYTVPYIQLTRASQQDVAKAMRTIAALESESVIQDNRNDIASLASLAASSNYTQLKTALLNIDV